MNNFWIKFKTGKVAVHTPTNAAYYGFIYDCAKQKMVWYNGSKARDYNIFPYSGKNTFISCGGRGVYGHLDFSCSADTYKAKGMEIIRWDGETAAQLEIEELVEAKKDIFEEKLTALAEDMEEDAVRMYALAYSMMRRQYAGGFIPLDCYDIRERMDNKQVHRLARICRDFSVAIDKISRKYSSDRLSVFNEYVDEEFPD